MADKSLIFQFDDVVVDGGNARIVKAGQPISVEPKALRVLLFLLEQRGRLVEKDELLTAVWPGTFVTENALTREIALLRRVLGDSKSPAKYIETVPKRGYRFVANVAVTYATVSSSGVAESAGPFSGAPPAGIPSDGLKLQANIDRPDVDRSDRSPLTSPAPKSGVGWKIVAVAMGLIALTAVCALVAVFFGQGRSLNDFLPAFHAVQVTSSTGLDIFPAFSPDGNTIAYCAESNGTFEIFLRPLARGSRIVQLTHDGGENLQPAWSPDGQWISYHSERKGGIWIIPALGGVARQVAPSGESPAWSPDSREIVFQSGGVHEFSAMGGSAAKGSTLWIVDVQSGSQKQITHRETPAGAHNNPSWSPDGKTIVFVANGVTTGAGIWTVSREGGGLSNIASGGLFFSPVYAHDGESVYAGAVRGSGDFGIWKFSTSPVLVHPYTFGKKIYNSLPAVSRYLAISPDGKRIAFGQVRTQSDLYLLPMSGARPSGTPVALTHDTRYRNTLPSFSPDGQRILFNVSSADRDAGVWLMDLVSREATPVEGRCAGAIWFPGGKSFVCFGKDNSGSGACSWFDNECTDIFKVEIDNDKREHLQRLRQNGGFLSLSRDGGQLAFTSQKNGAINVWLVPLGGDQSQQITFDKESTGFPAWSPDGRSLALEVQHPGGSYIAILRSTSKSGQPAQFDPDHANLTQLNDNPGESWPHSWSPDGEKIAFAGSRDGVWNLWWISLRDKVEYQLTQYSGLSHYVRYPEWSPAGNAIAYEYGETTGNIWMLDSRVAF